MRTEQEKAKTLLLQFSHRIFDQSYNRLDKNQKEICKQCALVAVELKLEPTTDCCSAENCDCVEYDQYFYEEVIREIKEL